jgi:hypothetical protein
MVKPRVKIKKDGISTFIATLLLMVLAVSAGVVIYAYTMGYLGGFGGPQTMGAISLDTHNFADGTHLQVYVRNIGKSTFELQSVYIDGVSYATFTPLIIDENEVSSTTITYAAGFGTITHVVKLVGVDNTQISFNAKSTHATGGTAPTVGVTPAGPLTMNVGQQQLFTATPSGGTAPYSYKWYLDSVEVIGQTAATYTYTAALGSHSVYATVTDSASTPVTAQSNTVAITVSAAPVTITLRPNAAGSTTELNAQGTGSANWDRVDEVTADESTTYVRGTGNDAWQVDTYNVPDQSLTGTITNVRIYIRALESVDRPSDTYGRTAIRIGAGSIQYGTQLDLTTSWADYYTNYATKTGNLGTGAWTWADINNLQIGVSLQSHMSSGSNWRYAECTQVWVEVTYTP